MTHPTTPIAQRADTAASRRRGARHLVRLGAALLAWIWLPATASADGLTRGGEIWLPVPTDDVRVDATASVQLALPDEDGAYQGVVTLTLKNPGKKPIEVALALPERPCDVDAETCNGRKAGAYDGLAVRVGDAVVSPEALTVDDGVAYKPSFGRVLGFKVALDARATQKVELRWTMGPTIASDGVYATVRGVGLWGKRLRTFDLDVHLPYRPWTVSHRAALQLQQYDSRLGTAAPFEGKPQTTLHFAAKRPKFDDAEVHFGTANKLGGTMRCPDPRAIGEAATGEGAEKRLAKLLVMRNDQELEDCRSLFLARQGFPFTDKEVAKRFYGKPVRSASLTETVLEGRDRPFARLGMQRNDRYTNSLHSKAESTTIDALAAELRRRRNN